MEQLSVGLACRNSFCENEFSGQFSSKQAEVFEFFSKQARHSPLPRVFLNFAFYERFSRIHLLNPQLHWKRRN